LVVPLATGGGAGDDAFLGLAALAAVLPLPAGGLAPLLDVAAPVDDADGAGAVVGQAGDGTGDAPLQQVAGAGLVPAVLGQEQLHGADGGATGQGDRLSGLAPQVR